MATKNVSRFSIALHIERYVRFLYCSTVPVYRNINGSTVTGNRNLTTYTMYKDSLLKIIGYTKFQGECHGLHESHGLHVNRTLMIIGS